MDWPRGVSSGASLVFRKAKIEPFLLEIVNHRLDVRGYLAL